MDNYKTIERKLRNREPFKGNSMWARVEDDTYTVYSYSTKIAWHNTQFLTHFISSDKYSVTTSRHQNLIRRAWAI